MEVHKAMPVILCIILAVHIQLTVTVTHERSLLWTEKLNVGDAKISAVFGDPDKWVKGEFDAKGYSTPAHHEIKTKSYRIALGFHYASRQIFWSDKGLKTMFRASLTVVDSRNYTGYTMTYPYYHGISTEVNGIAVDWISNSIYWTDSTYDWIIVAAMNKLETYRILINTKLDTPFGIAVHPDQGNLYWSDAGASPKIEVSTLAGEDRRVFVQDSGMVRPRGITIDYENGFLYWVDDGRSEISRVYIHDGTGKQTFPVTSSAIGGARLHGIAIHKSYIFVTDQSCHCWMAYNKKSHSYVYKFMLRNSDPYDIMVYDDYLQEPRQSRCEVLECHHICINLGKGNAKCACKQGYVLNKDTRTCSKSQDLYNPSFLFSFGSKLCAAPIHFPDREKLFEIHDMRCFARGYFAVEVIAPLVDGGYLFHTEAGNRTIGLVRLVEGFPTSTIRINTGRVRGLAVDWISANLYWSDETHGHIMVSRLDGSYPRVLISGLRQLGRLAVDPLYGKMYFIVNGDIHEAYMDGTNHKVFYNSVHAQSLVVDPHEERIFWTNRQQGAVYSIRLNKTGLYVEHVNSSITANTLTVFEDFILYADGYNKWHFKVRGNSKLAKESTVATGYRAHDVATFADYLQPTKISACDFENGGCDQMCLLKDTGRVCACAPGYHLASNQKSCLSFLVGNNCLLLSDPYNRQVYQIDLSKPDFPLIAVPHGMVGRPVSVDADFQYRHIVWLDREHGSIRSLGMSQSGPAEYKRMQFEQEDVSSSEIAIDSATNRIYYSSVEDNNMHSIVSSKLDGTEQLVLLSLTESTHSLHIHPERRLLFWAQDEQVYKVDLNVTFPSPSLVLDIGTNIEDLTLDVADNMLYIGTRDAILACTIEGDNQTTVYRNESQSFSALAAGGGYVYFVMQDSSGVQRVPNKGGKVEAISVPVFQKVTDMRIFINLKNPIVDANVAPNTGSSVDGSDKVASILPLVAAVVGGLLFLCILVLLVLLLVRRCDRKRELHTAPSQFDNAAHDNPTYMTVTSGMPAAEESPYENIHPPLGAFGGDVTPYASIRSKKSISSDVIVDKSDKAELVQDDFDDDMVKHLAQTDEVYMN